MKLTDLRKSHGSFSILVSKSEALQMIQSLASQIDNKSNDCRRIEFWDEKHLDVINFFVDLKDKDVI